MAARNCYAATSRSHLRDCPRRGNAALPPPPAPSHHSTGLYTGDPVSRTDNVCHFFILVVFEYFGLWLSCVVSKISCRIGFGWRKVSSHFIRHGASNSFVSPRLARLGLFGVFEPKAKKIQIARRRSWEHRHSSQCTAFSWRS
ncbi:hypothetical protein Bca101_049239 [Brassica carinata]